VNLFLLYLEFFKIGIFAVGGGLATGFFKNYRAVIISVIAFILSAVFSVSPVYVILGAGLAGFLLFRPGVKTGAKEDKP